jgi:hypothetical protein
VGLLVSGHLREQSGDPVGFGLRDAFALLGLGCDRLADIVPAGPIPAASAGARAQPFLYSPSLMSGGAAFG